MIRTVKTKAAAPTAAKTSPTKTSAAKRTAVADASDTPIASAGVADPAAGTAPAAMPPSGKLGALVALLQSEAGTTIEAMMGATGWQAHSVRGAISGSLKKKLGLEILSEKTEAGRIYRIASAAKAPRS